MRVTRRDITPTHLLPMFLIGKRQPAPSTLA